MALGIGGVILVAEAATTLAHGVFGDGCGGLGGYDGDEAAFEGGLRGGRPARSAELGTRRWLARFRRR